MNDDSDALGACGVSTQGLMEVLPGGPLLQAETLDAFLHLQAEASLHGFSLRIESGWRSFQKQVSIWNRKATGALPLLDECGNPLDAMQLDPEKRMWTILNWSALPGTSRHHWGSDLDIVDANAIPLGYEVQLTPQEVESTGIFGPLHAWLDARIQTGTAFGFERPFINGTGKIRPERWHLSHRPSALRFESGFDQTVLRKLLANGQLELLDPVLAHFETIFADYARVYFKRNEPI